MDETEWTVTGDIPYGSADGLELLLDMFASFPRRTGPQPALVWIHGGGWETGKKQGGFSDALGPVLARAGFVFISVNYRLSDQAHFPAQLHDVKAAVRWVRANAERLGVDPERIGAWGHSAGAHLAALLGTSGNLPELEGASGSPGVSSRVQAVMAISPATDFLELPVGWPHPEPRRATEKLVGGRLEERTELVRLANPMTHIRVGTPPFLIVHGTDDEVVPVEQAIALHAALVAAGCAATLEVWPGSDHNLGSAARGVTIPDAWQTVGEMATVFFDRTLRGAGA